MVFQDFSKAEKPQRKSMATAPVKSQPLHNFSLSFLKWGNNQTSNHRCRKLVNSGRESSPSDHRSSASEAESDGGSLCKNGFESDNRKFWIGSRSSRNRFSFSLCSSVPVDNLLKNPTASDTTVAGAGEVREKLFFRFRSGSKEESVSKNKSAAAIGGEGRGDVEELVLKPWNLRPRRAVFKVPNEIGGATKNGELKENPHPLPKTENLPKSLRLRGFSEAQNAEKKEKRKLSISLSREEIEEDVFVMTGSKPSRRPKKRAKNIQKQLDNVFPGLWLDGITPDSYRVPDSPTKM